MNGLQDVFIKRLRVLAPFISVSWGLLYLWLILAHAADDRVSHTLMASPLIYLSIVAAALLLVMQKRSGALKEILIIAFWLLMIMLWLVSFFSSMLNLHPGLNELLFYYECFLILFFCGSPLYLMMRIINAIY
ncbi:transporter [Pantoea eucrina]|uniref:Transporter n=2 Tax=Erwiniaceae TaxID=1903409 RepID=A0ABS1ZA65_9GAMM|nr:transporter [Pantoea sp. PSNIH1]MBM0749147.1 transporter [Pantoea eucrina]NIE69291.1 transporter [Pantoea sp. Acro-807]OIX97571.1 transporter [Pantoea sp. Ae16]RAU29573.1 transporter [Pantoea sp. RIT 413]